MNIDNCKLKKIDNIISIIIIAAMCIAVSFEVYMIITYIHPEEFREMNGVAVAKYFAEGKNPYSKALLDCELPILTNVYGFLAPLLWAPFVKLFDVLGGVPALPVCQILSVLLQISGTVFFYKAARNKVQSKALSSLATFFFFSCYWRYLAWGGAFPDQLGMLFLAILLFISTRDDLNHMWNPISYVILIILMFYTKQYFILVIPAVFFYLFENAGFKKALTFAVEGLAVGIASIILVDLVFPLYFPESFPITQGSTIPLSFSWPLSQLLYLSTKRYLYFVLMSLVAIAVVIYQIVKKQDIDSIDKSLGLNGAILTLPFVIFIARNDGTYYTYFLQLWIPFVILLGMDMTSRILRYLFSENRNNLGIRTKRCIVIVMTLLLVYSTYSVRWFIISRPENRAQAADWQEIYSLLDEYSVQGDILVPPFLTNYTLANDIYAYDYGHAEYNTVTSYNAWKNSGLYSFLFPETGIILEKNIKYVDTVHDELQEGKYSIVVLSGEFPWREGLESGKYDKYKLYKDVTLYTGVEACPTKIYVKK